MKNLILFLIFALNFNYIFASEADDIVKQLLAKADKVNNYKANVLIKVNFDFIKIDDRKAKISFEKPDKLDIEADGFAMLPKSGNEMEYINILKGKHTAIIDRNENYKQMNLTVLKVIPSEPDSKIILAELWVDTKKNRLYKLNAFSKSEGNFEAEFTYAKHPFDLPDKVTFNFEIKNPQIPSYMTGEMEKTQLPKGDGNSKGSVTIKYSDYKVNYK